jgi:hypothetical protein
MRNLKNSIFLFLFGAIIGNLCGVVLPSLIINYELIPRLIIDNLKRLSALEFFFMTYTALVIGYLRSQRMTWDAIFH